MTLPFTKMQAVGNDFVVVEAAVWGFDTDWAREAIRLCDRHKGIGGDGLLVVMPSEVADVRMRMFNPDGTEDMCGNGLRCVVRWAWERDLLRGEERVTASMRPPAGDRIPASCEQRGRVETLVGVRGVSVELLERRGMINADMGTPLFAPSDIPMLVTDRAEIVDYPLPVDGFGKITISAVNTGSTHTVIWVDALPDDDRFFALSPLIENHLLFPERTSVLWAKLTKRDPANSDLAVRIWERGAGETLGCGTGACAVVALAALQNKIEPMSWPVCPDDLSHFASVHSRGGKLNVIYSMNPGRGESPLILTGEAHTVYAGVIERDQIH